MSSPAKVRRRRGCTRVSSKNQVTLPVPALPEAGIAAGDELVVSVDGKGRLSLAREHDPLLDLIGSAPGLTVARDDRVVSVLTLAEVLVDATRSGQEAERRARLVAAFGLAAVDEPTAVLAARIRAEHPALRWPDALLLATPAVLDADVLTADGRWAAVSPRVRVVG